jgi:hypothetical protein
MSQHHHYSTCSLIPGIDGDLQVVCSRDALTTLIDVQSVHFDVTGALKHDHSTLRLNYDAVCELRDLLTQIAEPTDHRQPTLPAIWSQASYVQPIRPPVRSPRRNVAA